MRAGLSAPRLSAAMALTAALGLATMPPARALEPTLWVAHTGGLLPLALTDGTPLGAGQDLTAPLTLALDESSGVLWAFDGEALQAFGASGDLLLRATVPVGPGMAKSALAVDVGPGSVWLAVGDRLYRFAADGVLLGEASVPGRGPVALAADPRSERLWAASGARLSAFDPDGKLLLSHELARSETLVDVTVDAASGDLWLALATPHNVLRRLDAHLGTELELQLPLSGPPLERIAQDGTGGLWAASKQWLYRLDAHGRLALELRLFAGQGLGPGQLVMAASPLDGSVWVGLGRHLVHVGPDGTPLGSLELDSPINDLAAFGDLDPPVLRFIAPEEDAVLAQARPTLGLLYEDPGSGVDLSSLVLGADGLGLAASCSLGVSAASCLPEAPFSEGGHRLRAQIWDLAGNPSLPAEVAFTVDTVAPAAPDATRVEVHLQGAIATVRGSAGSVEPGARVTITNLSSGEEVRVEADTHGAFEAAIAAETGDALQVVASDGAGNTSPELRLPVAAPLTLTLTSPSEGTQITSSRVRVEGTHTGPPNSGIVVNGVVALVAGERFVADAVPLLPGENTLNATLTAYDGRRAEASVSIHSQAVPPRLELDVFPASGVAPLEVQLEYALDSTGEEQEIRADFDGDGLDEIATAGPTASLSHTYASPGLYIARVRVSDAAGHTHGAERAVLVLDPSAADAFFTGLWKEMTAALAAQDLEGALAPLNGGARRKYRPIFEALEPHLPEIVPNFSPLARITVLGDIAEYGLTREIEGRPHAFLVYFLQGADGLWRIDSM